MSQPAPTISIALATYNGSRYIRDQLNSLFNQTLPPTEIIVCDDNSTDDTVSLVRSIAATAKIPISVSINSSQLGYRENFMRAASLTSGELISFCDQDDVWHPEKLRLTSEAFMDSDVVATFHNAELADESGKRLGRHVHKTDVPSRVFGRLGMNPWNNPLGFTLTFRRELLLISDLRTMTADPFRPSESLAHDQWIPIVAGAFGKIAYFSDVFADYRQHPSNVYGIKIPKRTFASRAAGRLLRQVDYEQLSRVSLKISDVFETAQSRLPPDLKSKALDAQNRYALLSKTYAERHRIYKDQSLAVRVKAWRKMLECGAYGQNHPITFAQKALARDLVNGVLLGGPRTLLPYSKYLTNYDGSLHLKPLT